MERHNHQKTFWANLFGLLKNIIFGFFYLPKMIRSVLKMISCPFRPWCIHHFLEQKYPFWSREWRYWRYVGFKGFESQLFVIYFTIGLLGFSILTGAYYLFYDLRPAKVYELEDYVMDTMIRIYQPLPFFPANKKTSLVLFDIDESSYQKWGEPFLTPRDKLLNLIQFAVEDQAEVVIVDINLSRKDPSNPEHDKQLYQYLNSYSETCTPNKVSKRCPQILLARFLREAVDRRPTYKEQRSSFLDQAVLASKDVHWVSIEFDRESRYIVRRWRLWESTCIEEEQGGYPEILPSAELLTVALLKGVPEVPPEIAKEPVQVKAHLLNALHQFSEEYCIRAPSLDAPQPQTLKLGDDLILDLPPSPLQKRIFYRLSENSDPRMLRQLFEKFSAEDLIQAFKQERANIVADKVVIIGSSYRNSFDIHFTPVGEMPGAMMIMNAINSLLMYGELKELPVEQRLFIMIALLLMMSFFFIKFTPIWRLVLFFPIVIIMSLLNFLLLNQGMWFNFTFAILIFQLYDMVVTYTNCSSRFLEQPVSTTNDVEK